MAGIKVKVKTAKGKQQKKSDINIKAKTLRGALEALQKRPGNEWGEFDGDIEAKYKANADGIVTQVRLKRSYIIHMPTWSGYKKAPKACQDEWDRMWKKLEEHEEMHHLYQTEQLARMVHFLKQKTDLTIQQYDDLMAEEEKRAQTESDKFDKSTGNGKKKGVKLNITAECE